MAASAGTATSRRGSSTRKSAAVTPPQASGGSWRKDSTENAEIPRIEPTMSSRYASSGSKRANARAVSSAIRAITVAVQRKTTGSVAQIGRPVRVIEPK